MQKLSTIAAGFLVACLLFACSASGHEPPNASSTAKNAGDYPLLDPVSLADVLRPKLPNGWTLSVENERVVIERTEPVEFFNAIGLPDFKSDMERREYVRPQLRRETFLISLRLGTRLSQEEYAQTVKANWAAIDKARKDIGDGKLMPHEDFWRRHPQYGYRKSPRFDAGKQSIYFEFHQYGAPWEFWDKEVGIECKGVIDQLGILFRPYESGDHR